MLQDLRFALRAFRRAPLFALFAVFLLAIGIGSSTAIFSVLDAVVLRPLPYPEPERLVTLWETNREKSLTHEPISPVNFVDYRDLRQVFADGAAWWKPVIDLTEPEHEPLRVNTIETTANLFTVLGVQPLVGRGFAASPIHNPNVREAVISERLWRTRLGGDQSVVGSAIRLNGAMYTVTGVMPAGFQFPGDTDIWQLITWNPAEHSRGAHFMESVFRLRPGASAEQADRELDGLTRRLGEENRGTNRGWGARVVRLDRETVGTYRPALFTLLGAAGLLLLITCLNLANLLLARSTSREVEVAVRSAIGAGRARLLRQFAIESALLAIAGALGGVMASAALVRLLKAAPLPTMPRLSGVAVDARAVLFAVAVTTIATAIFGVLPAAAFSRTDPIRALRGARGSSAPRRRRLGSLVAAEIALAVVLLAGAGLLLRSVRNLAQEETGVRPENAATISVDLPYSYRDWAKVTSFYRTLLDRLREQPGVKSAGATCFLPLSVGWRIPFSIEGRGAERTTDPPIAQHHVVTPGYFDAVGATIASGRDFDARDTVDRPGVIIVNEALARRYWPAGGAVGSTIVTTVTYIGPLGENLVKNHRFEVIGVLRDIRNASLSAPSEPALYFPLEQFGYRNMNVVIRGSLSTRDVETIVRAAVRRLDSDLAIGAGRPMADVLGQAIERPRLLMWLMSAFAAAALSLAAIGLYGVLAYVVAQRTQELSVRAALGAEPSRLVWLVVRQALGMALAGAAAGVAGAYVMGRALGGFLYGVHPADGITYVGVVLLLVAVSVAASAIPARRAACVDPLVGLRAE